MNDERVSPTVPLASTRVADEEMTIDELAQASGTTARTIRSYQDRNLLPSPKIVGRTGYYGQAHLARLKMISRLLDQRFSLAAIAALFAAWESGQSLAHILGFVEELVPYAAEIPQRVTFTELEEAFGAHDPEVLLRAEHLGILQAAPVTVDGGRDRGNDTAYAMERSGARVLPSDPPEDVYDVLSPLLLQTGAKLVLAGVPIERLLDEAERLRDDCDRIASRFVDLFVTYFWQPFTEAGRPAGQLQQVVDYLAITRPLPIEATSVMIAQAMQRRLERASADIVTSEDARLERRRELD
jgi:DNA-binding transcriptional MerR regulator